ncbi:MAG: hydrogenase 4 subunit B, partial [Rhodospirillales bacterium]|nr:hydrogenase 4 subunit B [Rhodospirillales bacterium]
RVWPAHDAIDAAAHMTDGWILVPLSAGFAFISPSKLVIVMPLLALVPAAAILLCRRRPARRVPVWYGGSPRLDRRNATTALTFSNSLRTFYSFVYRPRAETGVETSLSPYFVKHLRFEHDVAPIFGPALFGPVVRLVHGLARRGRVLQSGSLNLYLGIIGLLLVAILVVALF